MRPFSTLGVAPFLWADDLALRQIQTQFYALSRRFHPDRTVNLPDDERESAEAQSAILNADYAKLLDVWKRLETVVHETHSSHPLSRSSKGPPTLSLEYFELQERWIDEGPGPAVQAAIHELRLRAEAEVQNAERAVLELAQHFPFCGIGEATHAPWSESDIATLSERLDRLRFARSFQRDLDTKFPRT